MRGRSRPARSVSVAKMHMVMAAGTRQIQACCTQHDVDCDKSAAIMLHHCITCTVII